MVSTGDVNIIEIIITFIYASFVVSVVTFPWICDPTIITFPLWATVIQTSAIIAEIALKPMVFSSISTVNFLIVLPIVAIFRASLYIIIITFPMVTNKSITTNSLLHVTVIGASLWMVPTFVRVMVRESVATFYTLSISFIDTIILTPIFSMITLLPTVNLPVVANVVATIIRAPSYIKRITLPVVVNISIPTVN